MTYYDNKEYISNSSLGWLEKSPAYFQAMLNSNIEQKQSLSLERGSLLHLAILEPAKFQVADIEPVTGMMGAYIEHRASGQDHMSAYTLAAFKRDKEASIAEKFKLPENQAYYNFLCNSQGKIVLSKQDKQVIDSCIKSLSNHSVASKLLWNDSNELFDNKEVYNELEIYWEYNDVKLKSKLDRVVIDHDVKTISIIDLKTTSESVYGEIIALNDSGNDPILDFRGTGFMKSYINYRYYRQQAFYQFALSYWLKNEKKWHADAYNKYKRLNYIIPVETQGLYECSVYEQGDDWFYLGVNEFIRLLNLYKWHRDLNQWTTPKTLYEKGLIQKI